MKEAQVVAIEGYAQKKDEIEFDSIARIVNSPEAVARRQQARKAAAYKRMTVRLVKDALIVIGTLAVVAVIALLV